MSGTITSEAELIATYLAPLARSNEGAFGLRDDCAVLTPSPGTDLVLTTDAVAAGVHFFADDPPEDIAWKALAVNLSDLAAKASAPRVYLLALSFPEPPTHAFLGRFASGLAEAQAAAGIVLAGGDTDRRPGPLTVTITAIGEVPAGFHLTRAGAREGDALFVTGTLGDAAFGLKLRRGEEAARAWALTSAERGRLVARYLRPAPRLDVQPALRRWATAAMDVSDGLAKDLARLAAASGVGAVVESACLPLADPVRRLVSHDAGLLDLVLGGGDDYEVLFTVAPDVDPELMAWSRAAGVKVTRIGCIAAGPGVSLKSPDAPTRPLAATGWDHFG